MKRQHLDDGVDGIDAVAPERETRHPERAPQRRRPTVTPGPNVGYWQAVGSSRAAAKRTKRP